MAPAPLAALISRVRAQHDCRPGATAAEIAETEARLGLRFTEELREFLSACNGVLFWNDADYPCRFLSTEEIAPVVLLRRTEGPPGLVALIEPEGTDDHVAIDLDPDSKSHGRIIDCFHETFPAELHGVCDSLPELLALILASDGQEWIWPAARAYDVDFAQRPGPET